MNSRCFEHTALSLTRCQFFGCNFYSFRELYAPLARREFGLELCETAAVADPRVVVGSSDSKESPGKAKFEALGGFARFVSTLPQSLAAEIQSKFPSTTAIARSHPELAETVVAAISSVVARSSRVQLVKGLLSAGVVKSLKYSVAKLKKGAFRKH